MKEALRKRLLNDARLSEEPRWVAYIMATVEHETGGTFKPVREKYGRVCKHCFTSYSSLVSRAICRTTKTDVHQFVSDRDFYFTAKYEMNQKIRIELGNTSPGDGAKYHGRGLVQITGKRNYTEFEHLLNMPLVSNPDLALEEDPAYEILVRGMILGKFTGHKLEDHINDRTLDLVNARKIINGLDKAQKIALYAAEELREMNLAA